MKKMVQVCLRILLFCGVIQTMFGSCKKEKLNSRELLVYLTGDYSAADNRAVVPFLHTPVEIVGNTMIEVPAYATREVPADIDVTMYPDVSLVDAFNLKYNTAYLPMPSSAFRVVNAPQHKIPAGSLVSDPIKIEITDPSILTDPNGYLLPMTITGIESKDKGVQISTTHQAMYLNITYEYSNIAKTETPLNGTLMNRTAWSVTVSNTTSGALGPAMLDGNNSTAWRSSNSSTAAKWVVLNMGSTQTVKGFQIVPNYVSTAENPTQMTISTSTDNVTYTVQGIWKGTGPSASSSAASPDIKGVNFIAPVTARYFRLDITSVVNNTARVGIGELNAVQ